MIKLLLLGCLAGLTTAKPTEHTQVSKEALDYLVNMGYYKHPESELGVLANEKDIRVALEHLQSFAGIPVSGILDKPTKDLLKKPRCGLPDISGSMKTRKRRYTLQGSTWKKTKLTWKLMNDNDDGLTRKQVEDAMTEAFFRWETITNLDFRKLDLESKEPVDIEVKFVHYYHDDPYPFDGPGGTLAHAFYPHTNTGLSGDVHFDDAEEYTLGSAKGKSLMWVAVHEIGHSLGLEHSNVREAIMYPWYKGYLGEDFSLTQDDVLGIQALYGARSQPTTTPKESELPSTVAPTLPPNTCVDQVQTVLLDADTKTMYVINGDKVYEVDEHLKGINGPYHLKKLFPELESVDSGYTLPGGKVVIFSGSQYFIYSGFVKSVLESSGTIHDRFKGLNANVKKIAAAFIFPGNGRTYLFSGEDYYRFNEHKKTVDYNYPRKIEKYWDGLPSTVDAAFTWRNGITYFFRGTDYYRMTSKATVEPNYPRKTSSVWFKCDNVGNISSSGTTVGSVVFISGLSVLLSMIL